MVAHNHGFAAAARGEPVPAEVWDGRPVGDQPYPRVCGVGAGGQRRVRRARRAGPADRAARAWAPSRLRIAIGFHFVDYLIHGWDVARAIGVTSGPGRRPRRPRQRAHGHRAEVRRPAGRTYRSCAGPGRRSGPGSMCRPTRRPSTGCSACSAGRRTGPPPRPARRKRARTTPAARIPIERTRNGRRRPRLNGAGPGSPLNRPRPSTAAGACQLAIRGGVVRLGSQRGSRGGVPPVRRVSSGP